MSLSRVRPGRAVLFALALLSTFVLPSPVRAFQDKDKDKAHAEQDVKSAEPKTADEAVSKGIALANGGDLDKALALFKKGVELDPKHRRSLGLVGRVKMIQASMAEGKTQRELFKEAAAALRQLKRAIPKLSPGESQMLGEAIYNEACAFSLDGATDKAMASLKEAFDTGFNDLAKLDEDGDLANVRKLPKFAELKTELVAKAEAAAKAKVAALLKETKSFPFDFALKNLDGKTVKMADFKGKVTIVDIWGTWCPPCRKEIPHFVDLHKKYGAKGLAIVGLNYENGDDEKEIVKTIKDFAKVYKIPYDCLIGDEKTRAQVPKFEGFPTTLFFDREGKVRASIVGFDPNEAKTLEMIVTTLLEEGAKP